MKIEKIEKKSRETFPIRPLEPPTQLKLKLLREEKLTGNIGKINEKKGKMEKIVK